MRLVLVIGVLAEQEVPAPRTGQDWMDSVQ